MKLFFLVLLPTMILWAASLDSKLYEGDNKEPYYQEIQKQIEDSLSTDKTTQENAKEELLQLSRVRTAASQTIQIEKLEIPNLSGAAVNAQDYYDTLNTVAALRYKIKTHRHMLLDVQSKLSFLKQKIDNITEEEKPKLLSYQLQFAYYKLQQKNIDEKIQGLFKQSQEIAQNIFNTLASVKCDISSTLDKKLLTNESSMEQTLQRKISLQISLENALIQESDLREQILKKIALVEQDSQKLLTQKIMFFTQESLCFIQKNNKKEYFDILTQIETLTSQLTNDTKQIYKEQLILLRELAKNKFGATGLFFGTLMQEMRDFIQGVQEYVSSPLFVFNEQAISILSIAKAFALIILGFLVGMVYKRWIMGVASRWGVSQMAIRLTANMGYYLIIILTFIFALSSMGIDMSSLSLIAGALSIGIGFGLQTVVSNLIAGLILMFERTIRIGDVIEVSTTLRGRVTDMRIRSTTIKTFDNIDIIIPNSSFIQNNVINWTLEDLTRRIHIPFSVAYATEVEDINKAILGELELSNLSYIKHHSEKYPEIWMIAMNSSSVDFELLVWVEWDNKFRPNSLKSDFLIMIYNALRKHHIEIPFPQLDLHVKQIPTQS
jgi:small-conductance mechanosensitive channel